MASRINSKFIVISLSVLLLLYFVIFPMGVLLYDSVVLGSSINFDNYREVYSQDNEVNVLLDIVHGSSLITILSEAVIHQTTGLVAIPFDVPGNVMVGCVHTERRAYRKKAAEEFIRMLQESDAVRERAIQWLE